MERINAKAILCSKRPVLVACLFFGLTFLLTLIGQLAQRYPSKNLPLMTWLPYAQIVVGTPPSVAGLLLLFGIYRWKGIVWLANQFNPAKIGWIWIAFGVSFLSPFEWAGPALIGTAFAAWASVGFRSWLFGLLDCRQLGRNVLLFPICIALPAAVECIVIIISRTFTSEFPTINASAVNGYLRSSLLGGLIGAGLFEEIGWRGFALPLLLQRFKPVLSSLLIGVLWGLWHFPNFVYREPIPWLEIAIYLWTVCALSILFTWTYSSTEGSLLACMCLHGAINAQIGLFRWPEEWWSTEAASTWVPLVRGAVYWVISASLVVRFKTVQ